MTSDNKIVFLSKQEYFDEIINKISTCKSGDYVALATMNINVDNQCAFLITSLKKASTDGAEVSLCYDSYNYLINRYSVPGPLFWSTKLSPKIKINPWKNIQKNINELESSGIKTVLTNLPRKRFSLPFSGRSHIKFCIINDTVYLGGCNLSSSNDIDIMVKITNKVLSKEMRKLNNKIITDSTVSDALHGMDYSKKINSTIDLLIDAGIKNQSLIFDNALDIIDQANKYIYMTCQFFPNSTTIKKLNSAHNRGVKVGLIYNHPSKHAFPKNLLHHLVILYYRQKYSSALFAHQLNIKNDYIHSKIILTEKNAIIGSHNFVEAGVAFGTAEIALLFDYDNHNQIIKNTISKQIKIP